MTNSIRTSIVTLTIVIAITISSIAQAADPININTGTKAELVTLMRVGPVLADRIIMYRTENGAFKTVDELAMVMGIGPRILEMNKGMMTVGDTVTSPEVTSEVPAVVETPEVPSAN